MLAIKANPPSAGADLLAMDKIYERLEQRRTPTGGSLHRALHDREEEKIVIIDEYTGRHARPHRREAAPGGRGQGACRSTSRPTTRPQVTYQ
ncbi:MAG: hypothetical protein U0797_19410 [Gemmataceae bacterium]